MTTNKLSPHALRRETLLLEGRRLRGEIQREQAGLRETYSATALLQFVLGKAGDYASYAPLLMSAGLFLVRRLPRKLLVTGGLAVALGLAWMLWRRKKQDAQENAPDASDAAGAGDI